VRVPSLDDDPIEFRDEVDVTAEAIAIDTTENRTVLHITNLGPSPIELLWAKSGETITILQPHEHDFMFRPGDVSARATP
jgi:hypothetical protein